MFKIRSYDCSYFVISCLSLSLLATLALSFGVEKGPSIITNFGDAVLRHLALSSGGDKGSLQAYMFTQLAR